MCVVLCVWQTLGRRLRESQTDLEGNTRGTRSSTTRSTASLFFCCCCGADVVQGIGIRRLPDLDGRRQPSAARAWAAIRTLPTRSTYVCVVVNSTILRASFRPLLSVCPSGMFGWADRRSKRQTWNPNPSFGAFHILLAGPWAHVYTHFIFQIRTAVFGSSSRLTSGVP